MSATERLCSSKHWITARTKAQFKAHQTLSAAVALVALILAPLNGAHGELVLVDGGESRAAVVLPDDPADDERRAAEEIVEHLELISGAKLEIVTDADAPDGLTPIRIGGAADEALAEAVRERGDYTDGFSLVVDDAGVSIRGLAAEGTLFGAFEMLEQLGVRWYAPGDWGRVVPEEETVTVEAQEMVQVPSVRQRTLSGWMSRDTPWYARQRLGGDVRSTGRHGMPGDPPRGTDGRQVCLSGDYAPGALDAVVEAIRDDREPTDEKFHVNMGPNDGGGYCQCDGCRELDGDSYDPLRAGPSMTDRYIWFFNRVLEELEDDFPNMHIVWYVYAAHFFPPEHNEPNPRIIGTFAPIDLDRNRGMDNPMSPDRHIFRHIIDGWADLDPVALNYRGYYNNLACPQFPWSQLERVRNEIPALYEQGLDVFRVEVIRQSWASSPITLYAATRVMWDVDTDVDALLEEFYEKFYGPAAEPMQAYLEGIESAFADTPYHTGSSYVYFPIFDDARRDTLRGHLEQAGSLAPRDGDGMYGERVWAAQAGFERLEIFLDMIEARNSHDFAAAYEKMEQYYELNDELADYVLEGEELSDQRRRSALVNYMERSDTRGNYFNRFFRSAVTSGHHRTVEAGELVAPLPDEWDFLTDPAEIGEIAGYYRPGELGGNWQPLKTTSRSWSDQGLHYYKGDAWYRAHVTIPDAFEGQPIYLWFGGVDNFAEVWVNGERLGTNREPLHGLPGEAGTFRPFDFLATDAVRFGEENTVSVRVTNDRLAELGTGGIISPVMFWSPDDPDWSPDDG